MTGILAHSSTLEADFQAIELAVMETERGRWFLSEFTKRNRHADTQVLLTALSRIEKSIAAHQEPAEIDKFRLDILEMSKAIARTRAEIAAIKPDDSQGGHIGVASGELDSIVSATESATSDILAAAERVQEAAWTLRESDVSSSLCDMLDERATEIYTACSFQDLTAQRIRKVIEALGFLEKRVNAMAEIWQFEDDVPDEPFGRATSASPFASDPSMSQADVDFVLVDDQHPQPTASADSFAELEMAGSMPVPAQTLRLPMEGPVDLDVDLDVQQPFAAAQASDIDEVLFSQPDPADLAAQVGMAHEVAAGQRDRLQLVHSQPDVDSALNKIRSGADLSADEAARALDALKGMSVEERTRLFS
jgi:hypothetical protein